MDADDILEFGLLFGGFELIEGFLTILGVVAILAIFVGTVVFLDFSVLTILVTGALMAGSAFVGGVVGMKAERLRRNHR